MLAETQWNPSLNHLTQNICISPTPMTFYKGEEISINVWKVCHIWTTCWMSVARLWLSKCVGLWATSTFLLNPNISFHPTLSSSSFFLLYKSIFTNGTAFFLSLNFFIESKAESVRKLAKKESGPGSWV